MPVSAVQNATTPVLGAPASNPADVDKIDFMNLLVAQIQNQDPLSPMDNAQFTEQITQFTMLDEISQMGDKLDESLMMAQSLNNTGMLALVGRECTVAGDQIHVADGQPTGTKINSQGGGTATVTVRDEAGDVVRTYTSPVGAGLNDVTWDGRDADGEVCADGEYTVSVSVAAADGASVEAEALMTGPVRGLRYENGIAVVDVFGEEFYVSEIYQVS
jgi:flagellar basal-body rod modification protein FlgD